jgi:hypothetical protein
MGLRVRRGHKQHATLVNVIMQRHLSTSVVQAINRICCRRVIDEQGRCPVSDVYILLPMNWQGAAILDDIQTNMPGIDVVPWDFEPDGPKVYRSRTGKDLTPPKRKTPSGFPPGVRLDPC